MSEPFPGETLIADGWQYRDLPRMTESAMEKLTSAIGEENFRWLTQARYETEDGVAVRGQCLISPAGLDRLRAEAARIPADSLGEPKRSFAQTLSAMSILRRTFSA